MFNLCAATHYLLIAPKTKQPAAATLAKHLDSKRLELEIDKGVAVAEFTVCSTRDVPRHIGLVSRVCSTLHPRSV